MIKYTNELTQIILNKFVDYTRDNLSTPFSQELKIGQYVCATNGNIVVLIPETEDNKNRVLKKEIKLNIIAIKGNVVWFKLDEIIIGTSGLYDTETTEKELTIIDAEVFKKLMV